MRTFPCFVLTIMILLMAACGDESTNYDPVPERDYRQDMRSFVQGISVWAKAANPGFSIVPQNGHQLLLKSDGTVDEAVTTYRDAIDGVGREDMLYGYDEDNVPTPDTEKADMMDFMDLSESNGIEVLVTDYCWNQSYVDDSYQQSLSRGYISFAADHRELDNIPAYPPYPYRVNTDDITSLGDAKNYLYLLDPTSYHTMDDFLHAIIDTDYDILLIDLFYDDTVELSPEDVAALKTKQSGGSRLVLAYMSIGEAEDYRYYWNVEWETAPPSWLEEENPDWAGNYKVQYWDPLWQEIIYGQADSYLTKIVDAGFDGVYLDIIDAFEYFEER